jgi:hypothetical protein
VPRSIDLSISCCLVIFFAAFFFFGSFAGSAVVVAAVPAAGAVVVAAGAAGVAGAAAGAVVVPAPVLGVFWANAMLAGKDMNVTAAAAITIREKLCIQKTPMLSGLKYSERNPVALPRASARSGGLSDRGRSPLPAITAPDPHGGATVNWS